MSVNRKKAVVLGAGFAGLWIARRLLKEGFEVEVLEKRSQPGGLMETVSRNGFLFDVGPHILLASHLDHYRGILGEEPVPVVPGFYGFGYQGMQILSPLTPGNLFRTLGPGRALPFAASMAWHKLPFIRPRPPWDNTDELITARFGKRVNRALFQEYVPKVTGLPSTEVSPDWFLERHRFYKEHSLGKQLLRRALQSMRNLILPGRQEAGKGLQLYYPRRGAQMLTDTMFSEISRQAARVLLNAQVTGIHAGRGRVEAVTYETEDRQSRQAQGDLFVSTLPVTHLAGLFSGEGLGAEAQRASGALAWRRLWLFYLSVRQERVSDKIQIYFTEKKHLFKRIYEPKNLLSDMGPRGETALCVEVCYNDEDAIDRSDEQAVFQNVKKGVCEFYLLRPEQVELLFSRRVPYAYAVYRKGYEKHLSRIASALFSFDNFVSYGRQGSYRYNYLVDRIIDASEAVMQYVTANEGKAKTLREPRAKSDFF